MAYKEIALKVLITVILLTLTKFPIVAIGKLHLFRQEWGAVSLEPPSAELSCELKLSFRGMLLHMK